MLVCKQPAFVAPAQNWAEKLNLSFEETSPDQGFYLVYDHLGLALVNASEPRVLPVRVDFLAGATAHRRAYGGGRGQALAKACGLKPGVTPRILDATAGLAGDAFVLASLGCSLLAIERHPWVAALVEDALLRASTDSEVASITQHLRLLRGDATQNLAALASDYDFAPQVVYLDPMFPHSEKSAQVKKEMQFFRDLVGKDQDADALLDQALAVASHRVVVKRPRRAPPLAGKEPALTLAGKANRFDIYPLKALAK